MANANMTFKANLLPNSNLGYNLGSSSLKWNVYGILNGTATYASNASYATNAASATYANSSNCANHAIHSGSATYAASAAQATHSASAVYASTAGSLTPIITSGNYKNGFATAFDGNGYGEIATGLDWHVPTSTNDFDIRMELNQSSKILQIVAGSGWNSGFSATTFYGTLNGNSYHSSSSTYASSAGSVAWGNVTGKPSTYTPSSHTHDYAASSHTHNYAASNHTHSYRADTAPTGGAYWRGTPLIGGDGVMEIGRIIDFHDPGTSTADFNCRLHCNGGPMYCTSAFYGAVWNDYAEMRNVPEANERLDKNEGRTVKLAGRCVHEVGDDTMVLSTERMQPGCKVISDTFGFNIGETDDCKTPIAVSGRALVYIYEGREVVRQYIGQPVCSGPDGTVSIMTDEEYAAKGYCCVGTISAIPEYETWGSGNIQVDGRIWIYVK